MAAAFVGRWREYSYIFPPVASYWVCSIGLVFLNQHLLTGAGAELNAPLFITWCQCLVTVMMCSILSWGSRRWTMLPKFPKLDVNWRTCIKILPLSVVFVTMISLTNLCLQLMGVSFYYIGRSLATVFSVLLSPYVLGVRSSRSIRITCVVIIIGFLIGQKDIKTVNILGILCGTMASFAVALNAMLTKTALPHVNGCIWRLTWYNNLLASVLFIPLMVLFGDVDRISNSAPNSSFWMMLLISGLFGFMMNYVTGWQIEATSPLTHNISANAKSAAQSLLAVIVFQETKPIHWWISNAVILFGTFAYTDIRNAEMKRDEEARKLKTQ